MNTTRDPLVTIQDMLQRLKISRTTLYRRVKSGRFPPPIKKNGRTLGWREQDLEYWKQILPPSFLK